VAGYELMKTLKENAVERAHTVSTRLDSLQGEIAELRIKVADLQELLTDYRKLDMVTELMQEDQLEQSIREINATILRYGVHSL